MVDLQRVWKGIKNPWDAYQYLSRTVHPVHILENPSLFATSRYPVGTHVLEREWDVLVILDTCRVDALQIVADEYNYLNDIGHIWSRGGTSPEWIAHTFDRSYETELSNSGYISANPHAKTVLEDREMKPDHSAAARRFYRYGSWDPVETTDLELYDPVNKYYSDIHLDDVTHVGGVTPPRYVTDRAINVSRSESLDRMILHYMQPHYPWVSNAISEDRDIRDFERDPEMVKEAGWERVFGAYLDDLRYVLDEVELLLSNLDADRVAISADHGDAFGEYRVYGHGPGRFIPEVRRVPWVTVEPTDTHTYEPIVEPPESVSTDTADQLAALGYV